MRILFFLLIVLCLLPAQADGRRNLILPLQVDRVAEEPWEGLALMLALQNRASDRNHLVPLTAVRKRLGSYGLTLTMRTSLATKLKLAESLEATTLVYGTIGDEMVQVSRYHLTTRELEIRDFPHESYGSPGELLTQIAAFLDLPTNDTAAAEIEIGRVWASTYFAEDLEAAQAVLDKLIDHETVGWLFMQEYLDRFGDPLVGMEATDELVTWRDLFVAKQHYSHALTASKRLLSMRNYPRDLLIHAKVLHALDRRDEACSFAHRSEQFGFVDHALFAILEACDDHGADHIPAVPRNR